MKAARLILACICLLVVVGLAQAQSDPVPLINQPLVPTSAVPGSPGFTLTVNGTGFVSGATVNWNGAAMTTTFVSGSQLTATVPAANIATAGTASITVIPPGPGQTASSVVFFQIATPIANLAVNPSLVTIGLQTPVSFLGGDFNGDGKPDLIALDALTNNAQFVQGNGDGTFSTPQPLFAASPSSPALQLTGDFNHDGKLDFVVRDNSTLFLLRVFLGNGDGTFLPVDTSLAGQGTDFIGGVIAGDFNNDGKLDLVCSCGNVVQDPNAVQVLPGNGDGTFQLPFIQSATTLESGFFLSPAAVADFNGDGKLDLIVTGGALDNVPSGAMEVLLGNGDGTFTQGQNYIFPYPLSPMGAVAADFNGDGKLDLVVGAINDNNTPATTQLFVFVGNGDGTFQPPAIYDVNSPGGAPVAVGDFNADGVLDIAVQGIGNTGSSNPQGLIVFFGNGDGTFRQATVFTEPAQLDYGGATAIADFNSDGRLDFVPGGSPTDSPSDFGLWSIVAGVPTVTLVPASLTFSQQAIGTTSLPQTTVLTNLLPQALTISNIGIIGANASDFAQTNTCGTSLASNASCQINVTFTPTASEVRTASVSVSDNGPGSPQTVSLTGNSQTSAVTLSPLTISFPSQYVGTTGLPQTVTLSNNGTSTVTIASVTASPADFGVLNACGSSVAPGMNCTIGVFFDPTVSGTRTGTLTVTDNAGNSPQTVSLSGTGQDFSMATGSQSSATVSPGQTANYTVALTSVGGFSQQVTLSCNGAPPGSICTVPSTVTVGGSGATIVDVTVKTATSASLAPPSGFSKASERLAVRLILCGLPGVVILGRSGRGRNHRRYLLRGLAFFCLLAMGVGMSACGGGNGSTMVPSATTYNVAVTGTFTSGSTSLTHTARLTLVVQ
jgi:hypothetical protein